MASFYGHPSRYLNANKSISKYGALAYLIYFVIIILIVVWRLSIASFSLPAVFAIALVFGPLLLFTDSLMRKEESLMYKFRSGIVGEKLIGDELRKLDAPYTVFQDVHVPGKKENIDFVVVGPTGIHAIEVNNHRGMVGFNGDELTHNQKPFEKDFLRQTMREATSLHDYLISSGITNAFVIPIIVFSHRFAIVRFGIQPIKNVRVIQYRWLIKMIMSEPRTYPDQRVVDLLKATYTAI
jgi:hypothetical protein